MRHMGAKEEEEEKEEPREKRLGRLGGAAQPRAAARTQVGVTWREAQLESPEICRSQGLVLGRALLRAEAGAHTVWLAGTCSRNVSTRGEGGGVSLTGSVTMGHATLGGSLWTLAGQSSIMGRSGWCSRRTTSTAEQPRQRGLPHGFTSTPQPQSLQRPSTMLGKSSTGATQDEQLLSGRDNGGLGCSSALSLVGVAPLALLGPGGCLDSSRDVTLPSLLGTCWTLLRETCGFPLLGTPGCVAARSRRCPAAGNGGTTQSSTGIDRSAFSSRACPGAGGTALPLSAAAVRLSRLARRCVKELRRKVISQMARACASMQFWGALP